MFRLLGIDFGTVRIGLALSDPLKIISKPFKTLPNENIEQVTASLKKIIKEESVGEIILGLPVNLDGDDTQKTKEVRIFKEQLEKEINIPIHFQDERYTSSDAHTVIKKMKMTPQEGRKIIDQIAASFILRNYMEKIR
ncbi:MAG: Holliday junction resolvase RuvX [Candidatus Cloacimonadota bacterium]|nr:MAG: Holliday junction resolvase RuvX [Candidatus Cloacimonadota bacterium]